MMVVNDVVDTNLVTEVATDTVVSVSVEYAVVDVAGTDILLVGIDTAPEIIEVG